MPDFSDRVRSSERGFFAARAAEYPIEANDKDYPENYGVMHAEPGEPPLLATLSTAALAGVLFDRRSGSAGVRAQEERNLAVRRHYADEIMDAADQQVVQNEVRAREEQERVAAEELRRAEVRRLTQERQEIQRLDAMVAQEAVPHPLESKQETSREEVVYEMARIATRQLEARKEEEED